jgi:hypothetical protein
MPWFIEDRQTTNVLSTCCVQGNGELRETPNQICAKSGLADRRGARMGDFYRHPQMPLKLGGALQ